MKNLNQKSLYLNPTSKEEGLLVASVKRKLKIVKAPTLHFYKKFLNKMASIDGELIDLKNSYKPDFIMHSALLPFEIPPYMKPFVRQVGRLCDVKVIIQPYLVGGVPKLYIQFIGEHVQINIAQHIFYYCYTLLESSYNKWHRKYVLANKQSRRKKRRGAPIYSKITDARILSLKRRTSIIKAIEFGLSSSTKILQTPQSKMRLALIKRRHNQKWKV